MFIIIVKMMRKLILNPKILLHQNQKDKLNKYLTDLLNNDNDYNAIDGAGTIIVGFNVQGMGVWRGALYVFGDQRIAQITGTKRNIVLV
jgi:accessory colonization factor AcfC